MFWHSARFVCSFSHSTLCVWMCVWCGFICLCLCLCLYIYLGISRSKYIFYIIITACLPTGAAIHTFATRSRFCSRSHLREYTFIQKKEKEKMLSKKKSAKAGDGICILMGDMEMKAWQQQRHGIDCIWCMYAGGAMGKLNCFCIYYASAGFVV